MGWEIGPFRSVGSLLLCAPLGRDPGRDPDWAYSRQAPSATDGRIRGTCILAARTPDMV